MLEPGSLVAGKLRIERILGQGGMGTVAAATHVGLDQRVAIKVLKPELANQPDVAARFVREARAAAKLKSDHVCRVTDVGETADGVTYIEMELLEGQDLASLIAIRPLTVDVAADYIVQACVALAEAHHLGIIHRDLKPANLFVTHRLDGSALIKVLDFGIATAPSAEDFKITKTTTVMGSPGYMSPEHLRSARDVDVRSDIWALGVILYEAVTGRLPFSATSITELAVKVVMDDPLPLTNVDPRYAAIVARCLKKPPDDRYQTVGELTGDLVEIAGQGAQATAHLVAKLLGGSPSRSQSAAQSAAQIPVPNLGLAPTVSTMPPAPSALAPAAPVAPAVVPSPPSTTLSSAASSTFSIGDEPPKKKRRTALVAIAAVAVLGAGAAAFALVERDTEKPVHAAHRHDAGVPLVSSAAPNDASRVANTQVVGMLGALVDAKDYRALLTEAGKLDQHDPQIAPIIADAKQKLVEQETKRLADHASRGECAAAKAVADSDAALVPEAKALFEKAATCTAKPTTTTTTPTTPTTPTTTATKPTTTPPATNATADQAVDAFTRRDYRTALDLAEQVLQKSPKDTSALGTAIRAACALHETETARKYFVQIPATERNGVVGACSKDHVDVMGQLAVDATTDVSAAQAALDKGDYPTATAQAKATLKIEPTNKAAILVLGVVACRTHDKTLTDDVERRTRKMPQVARRISHACSGQPDE